MTEHDTIAAQDLSAWMREYPVYYELLEGRHSWFCDHLIAIETLLLRVSVLQMDAMDLKDAWRKMALVHRRMSRQVPDLESEQILRSVFRTIMDQCLIDDFSRDDE